MILDICLSPTAEAKLRETARASGKDVNALASELLESAVVGPGAAPVSENGANDMLDHVFEPLIDEARRLPREPTPVPLQGTAAEFADAVASDLRRQGLKA